MLFPEDVVGERGEVGVRTIRVPGTVPEGRIVNVVGPVIGGKPVYALVSRT